MIPSILWQTWKTTDIPHSVKIQADTWKHSNPQLELRFMDDLQCAEFIKEHFGDEVYVKYMALPQPIMRADFWRLAAVYVHGGYYADLDIRCGNNIADFVPQVDAVFMREVNNISNYFFGAVPGHPVIRMAIDHMIAEMDVINERDTQSFGMHPLHHAVRTYYNVIDTNYTSSADVHFILDAEARGSGSLVHSGASSLNLKDYESWRARNAIMIEDRRTSSDIRFVTTFNANGYELYGKTWIDTFMTTANYYPSICATIYYEGFKPTFQHPSIEWVNYKDAAPDHTEWKISYQRQSRHSDYVRTMCIRFSHKAFVIQHALDNYKNNYVVWLDGDCIFKGANYANWPQNIMEGKFLACQVEHASDLNHVESGILIFDTTHPDTSVWNRHFKQWYQVDNILGMGQPYDGFIVFKSLLTSGAAYADLNKGYGRGGIQSDPGMTFQHPEIKSKFIHNIGWTGKNQYDAWDVVYSRDDVFQRMKLMLFGHNEALRQQKQQAHSKLEELRRHRV